MNVELRWIVSVSTSALHAATAILQGRTLADAALSEALTTPARALGADLDELPFERDQVLSHLVALSAGIENNRQLANLALTKVAGRGAAAPGVAAALAGRISDLEAALGQVRPELIDELALRAGPLRQLWDERGPGMMAAVGRWTDANFVVSRADVVLVHPALGGDGVAHLPYNSVRLEAVLANPTPELPEVVRLGWLLSMLNFNLPIYSESIPPARWPFLAAVALVPIALASAGEVDWASGAEPAIRLALEKWHVLGMAVAGGNERAGNDVEALLSWWRTYQDTRPRWPVALAALDQMLAGPEEGPENSAREAS